MSGGDESSSEDDDDEDSAGGAVVQRRPTFTDVDPTAAPTRERISRSSKTLAQDKMTKLADENTENGRLIGQLE